MFKIMDKYRTPAQIILGLIGISFLGFGMLGFQSAPNNMYLVKIGDQIITRQQLDEAIRNTEQNGGVANRNTVLQTLMSRAYLMEGAKRMGVVVADTQIKQMIVDNPMFHDEKNQFSPQLFKQILQQARMSEQQYMDEQRKNLLIVGLSTAINQGAISDWQVNQMINAVYAPREVRSIAFMPKAFVDKVKVDDVVLKKYYDANKKNYVLKQGVKFQFIRFSVKDLLAKQKVSDEELKQAMQEQHAQSKQKRHVYHILIAVADNADAAAKKKAQEQAAKIAAEAKAHPNQFSALAKKYSQDAISAQKGGDLGEITQNSGLDKAVEDAAFALKEGEISGVVNSKFGYHVIYVSNISSSNSEEERKAAALASIQEKKAQQAYSKMREDLEQLAFASPGSLQIPADKLGLPVQTQEQWLTRDNAAQLQIPVPVVDALFSDEVFVKKHNSEVIGVNGVSWLVRALETRAQKEQSFDQVKDQVKEDYIRTESLHLAESEAKKMVSDLQAGKKVDLQWSAVVEVSPEQAHSLPPQAYQAFMKAVPHNGKSAYAFISGGEAPEIMEVLKIKPIQDAQLLTAAKQGVLMMQGESLLSNYINSLRNQIPTEQGAERLSE